MPATYYPSQSGSSTWGSITGTLSNQTDLNNELIAKTDKEITVVANESITAGTPVMLDWVTGKARKPKRFHTIRYSAYLNGISGWAAQYPVTSLSLGDGRIVYFTTGTSTVLYIFNANTDTWGVSTTVKSAVGTYKGMYWDALTERLVVTYIASSIHYYRMFTISGNTITAVNTEAQIGTSTTTLENSLCGDGQGTVFASTYMSSWGNIVAGIIDPINNVVNWGTAIGITSGTTVNICFLNFSGTKRICVIYPNSNTTVKLYSYSGTTFTLISTTVVHSNSMTGGAISRISTDGNSKVAVIRSHSSGGSADKQSFLLVFNVTESSVSNGNIYMFDNIRCDSVDMVYDAVTKYFVVSHHSTQSGIVRCFAFDLVNGKLMISKPFGRTSLYQSASSGYVYPTMCYDAYLDLIVYGLKAFTETAGNYYVFNNAYDERMFVIGIAKNTVNTDDNLTIVLNGIIDLSNAVVGGLYNINNTGNIALDKTNFPIGIGLPNNKLLIKMDNWEVAP